MKITISDIIKSDTAAYQDEGLKIYELLEKQMSTQSSFELSFERLDICSTLFLNSSIGKLYRNYTQEQIESFMTIVGIDINDSILPKMIKRAISKALETEFYESILNQALELA